MARAVRGLAGRAVVLPLPVRLGDYLAVALFVMPSARVRRGLRG